MTVLVTGGAGFIGSNFVLDWCAGSSESIVNLDKLTYAGNPDNLAALVENPGHSLVRGDIGDPLIVSGLLKAHSPRAVINFAAESHVDRSIEGLDPFIQTNVVGTCRLLSSVRDYWLQLGERDRAAFRFLHVSTDEVYGSLEPGDAPFSERTAYSPNSPYAASKAASDHFVRAFGHTYGLPVLTTNCSNNYGPFQFPEKLIPLVIHNAIAGKQLPVYGDGRQVRDWLFVADHCSAIRRVLEHGQAGAVYNIGGGAEMANLTVVRSICLLLDELRPLPDGTSYSEAIRFVTDRPGHDRRYAVNAGKIMNELKWRPLESFESGLRKTVNWYLGHPRWVERATSGEYRGWVSKQYGALQ